MHREEREKQTNEFVMKTLEEERLLREHMQCHPPSTVLPTWEERLQMAEAQHKTSLLIDHITIRQTQSSAEAQALTFAFAQLSKDITNNQQQLFLQVNQLSPQIDYLSSRIDDIETSSNRSRSWSRSNHSSQRRSMMNENPRYPDLPVTVEDVEDERNSLSSLFRTKFRKIDSNTNRSRTKESQLRCKLMSSRSLSIGLVKSIYPDRISLNQKKHRFQSHRIVTRGSKISIPSLSRRYHSVVEVPLFRNDLNKDDVETRMFMTFIGKMITSSLRWVNRRRFGKEIFSIRLMIPLQSYLVSQEIGAILRRILHDGSFRFSLSSSSIAKKSRFLFQSDNINSMGIMSANSSEFLSNRPLMTIINASVMINPPNHLHNAINETIIRHDASLQTNDVVRPQRNLANYQVMTRTDSPWPIISFASISSKLQVVICISERNAENEQDDIQRQSILS